MPAVRVIAALQGREVFCKDKSGVFEGSVIKCHCCEKEYAPSAFEHHAGSSFRRPWKSIKDITGKSIQEYREEYEREQADAHMKTSNNEDLYVVEKVISSRLRNGKKEYLVKWENFDSSHNAWIPPENFGSKEVIAEFERKMSNERKRKNPPELTIQSRKQNKGYIGDPTYSPYSEDDDSQSSPDSSPAQGVSPVPATDNHEWGSSYPGDREVTSTLEPLFADSVYSDYDGSRRDSVDSMDFPGDFGSSLSGEEMGSPILNPINTITVDFEGMRGTFVQVATFRDLLDCALEYWEMNELTTPKNWVLTSEKGAIWPLNDNIDKYSPEVVYLKRKPWK